MAKQTVSRTAQGAAIFRLIEQYQPENTRLFSDPVVKALVDAPVRMMLQVGSMREFTIQQSDAVAKGIYGVQVCRTRYIDDAVRSGLAQGIGQLVILGAGLDTRPYRLPGMAQVKVFEADLPAVQSGKKEKLQKYLGRLPENVTFIPLDFDSQTLEAVFSGTNFEPASRAIFIWEGVTQYLTEEAVRQTLTFIGKSAPGSLLVFTYVLKSVIERRSDIPDAKNMVDAVANQAPWIFGLEPGSMVAYLRPFHLAVTDDAGSVEYKEKFLQPLGRRLDIFAGERIVQAVVTGP